MRLKYEPASEPLHISQLKAQGPYRTCNESKEEETLSARAEAAGAGRIETTENPAGKSAVVRNRFLPICKRTTFTHVQENNVYPSAREQLLPICKRRTFIELVLSDHNLEASSECSQWRFRERCD